MIRYDWRGCGLSDRDGIQFSLEKHTEDLEAVVRAAGLDSFVLFACAGGATVSMRFCRTSSGSDQPTYPLCGHKRGEPSPEE